MTLRAPMLFPLLALAACAVGPDYSAPNVAISPTWRTATGTIAPDGHWWRSFGDPVLDQLVERALIENLSIEAALARVDQAQAAARSVGVARLPIAEVNGTAARTQQSLNAGLGQLSRFVPDFPRSIDFGSASIGANWDIDFAGGARRRAEAASAQIVGAQAGVEAARNAVVSELADAYFSLRSAQAQAEAIDTLQKTLADRAEIMAIRLKVGSVSSSQLAVSKAALAEVEERRAQLDALTAAAQAKIAVLIGTSASEVQPELVAGGPAIVLPEVGAGLPGDVIRARPDVRAVEAQLIAVNAGIGAALAEYYPKLSLSGLIGFQSNRFASLINGDSVNTLGALGLRWRLFDFGRVDAEVAAARGRKREALAAYRLAVLTATAEVESAFGFLGSAQASLSAAERRRAAIGVQLRSAEAAFRVGQISRDALLEIRSVALVADSEVANAHGTALAATVAANRAIGVPIRFEQDLPEMSQVE